MSIYSNVHPPLALQAAAVRGPDWHGEVGVRAGQAHARPPQGEVPASICQLLRSDVRQPDTGKQTPSLGKTRKT